MRETSRESVESLEAGIDRYSMRMNCVCGKEWTFSSA